MIDDFINYKTHSLTSESAPLICNTYSLAKYSFTKPMHSQLYVFVCQKLPHPNVYIHEGKTLCLKNTTQQEMSNFKFK